MNHLGLCLMNIFINQNLPVSQYSPVYHAEHLQIKLSSALIHVPLFKQGDDSHTLSRDEILDWS